MFVPACQCTRWPTQIWTESLRARKSRKHFVLLSRFWFLYEISTFGPLFVWFLYLEATCEVYYVYITLRFLICCSRKIKRRILKKNPLKNLRVMMKLNPYAKTARRRAIMAHNPDVSTLAAWFQDSQINSSLHMSCPCLISLSMCELCRSRPRCWNPRRRKLWRRPRSQLPPRLKNRVHYTDRSSEMLSNKTSLKNSAKSVIFNSLHTSEASPPAVSCHLLNKPFIIIYKFL